jgi:plasmid stability protein
MKITLDLPDALIKQVKLRALREGRKLKDAVAELLREGLALAPRTTPRAKAAVVTRDTETGLPLIRCKQAPRPAEQVTPERVSQVLLTQETEWHHTAGR